MSARLFFLIDHPSLRKLLANLQAPQPRVNEVFTCISSLNLFPTLCSFDIDAPDILGNHHLQPSSRSINLLRAKAKCSLDDLRHLQDSINSLAEQEPHSSVTITYIQLRLSNGSSILQAELFTIVCINICTLLYKAFIVHFT